MKSIEPNPIPEMSIDELMDRFRSTSSRILHEYLRICKKHDRLKTIFKEEKMNNFFIPESLNFNEETGKITREIIHGSFLSRIEKYLST